MTEPIRVKGILLDAVYVDIERTVAFLVECEKGRFQTRIGRDQIATFGNRTESEICIEMNTYVNILKDLYMGKEINIVFNDSFNEKDKTEESFPLIS